MCVEAPSCRWPITQPLACCWLELATSRTGTPGQCSRWLRNTDAQLQRLFLKTQMACFCDAPFVFHNGGRKGKPWAVQGLANVQTGFVYSFWFCLSFAMRSEVWNMDIRRCLKCHFFANISHQKLNQSENHINQTPTQTFLLLNQIRGKGEGSTSSGEIARRANLDVQRSNNIHFNQCAH